jgi:hypothetical protein
MNRIYQITEIDYEKGELNCVEMTPHYQLRSLSGGTEFKEYEYVKENGKLVILKITKQQINSRHVVPFVYFYSGRPKNTPKPKFSFFSRGGRKKNKGTKKTHKMNRKRKQGTRRR